MQRDEYEPIADLWDLISPAADHEPEARAVSDWLAELLPAGGRRRVLELGSGLGHGAAVLGERFDVVGVDASPAMVERARARYPDLAFREGDMRSLRREGRFAAVVAYDAIDHLATRDDLERALAAARAHLDPGGGLLLKPVDVAETFEDGQTARDDHADATREAITVSRVERVTETSYDFALLAVVREKGALRSERVVHRCGLFEVPAWLGAIADAGFDPWPVLETEHGILFRATAL